MVSKKFLSEMHTGSWLVLVTGLFFIAVPYIFKISDFNLILFYTIVGIALIKISIIFRENLRIDKVI